jgi:phosphatidylglycerol:prolipoprotein diacylglycerol transferase
VLPYLEIGPVSLPTFGLMLVAAYILGQILVAERFQELGWPTDWAGEVVFVAVVSGIAGAALHYVLQHASHFAEDPVARVLEGPGLVWYGGLAAGVLGAVLWARWRGILGWPFADTAFIATAGGLAVGRIGCQLSGDGDYGRESDLPWAMGYPDGIVPTPPGVEVHPAPLYEAIALGLICIWLWRHRDSFRPGVITACFLVLMGTTRFLIELIRLNDEVVAGLTIPQLWSLMLIGVGGALLLMLTRAPQPRAP